MNKMFAVSLMVISVGASAIQPEATINVVKPNVAVQPLSTTKSCTGYSYSIMGLQLAGGDCKFVPNIFGNSKCSDFYIVAHMAITNRDKGNPIEGAFNDAKLFGNPVFYSVYESIIKDVYVHTDLDYDDYHKIIGNFCNK